MSHSSKILVIGSCHLDIFADRLSIEDDVDQIAIKRRGKILISAGGTGFNVAISLALHGESVSIYTKMHPSYIGRKFITSELDAAGVNSRIQFDKKLDSYFFIAHRSMHGHAVDIDHAISNDGIIDVLFDSVELKRIINYHEAVVICCNYPVNELRKIIDISASLNKRVYISGVGEELVTRLADLRESLNRLTHLMLISMDRGECLALMRHIDKHSKRQRSLAYISRTLCTELNCKNVVISAGALGATLSNGDELITLSPPEVVQVQSTTGAGDALFASLISALERNENILDKEKAGAITRKYIIPVLQSLHANSSRAYFNSESRLNYKALEILEKKEKKRERIFNVALSFVSLILGAIIALIVPNIAPLLPK